jgi:hypothetical protein
VVSIIQELTFPPENIFTMFTKLGNSTYVSSNIAALQLTPCLQADNATEIAETFAKLL